MARNNSSTNGNTSNGFCFDTNRHDFGDKVFLGRRIAGKGEAEVEQALDILARHPATARFISFKLAQYFVADQPPSTLVNRLAERFSQTNGEMKAVLNTLFSSPEFWDGRTYNAKFKSPYYYVISSLRATGAQVDNPQTIVNTLNQMGMPLHRAPSPAGYANTQAAWLGADALNRRLNFAVNLGNQSLPGVSFPVLVSAQGLEQTLGGLSPQLRQTLATSPNPIQPALVLGSPDFMKF
jgi:uncharacterized protein (DUF1800 family)